MHMVLWRWGAGYGRKPKVAGRARERWRRTRGAVAKGHPAWPESEERQKWMTSQRLIDSHAAEMLDAAIAGDVFVPGDSGYEQARQAWNLTTDERPAAVVAARSASHLVKAVLVSRTQGM